LAGAIGLGACGNGGGNSATGNRSVGFVAGSHDLTFLPPGKRKLAPAVSGQTIQGGTASVTAFRGKVLVVNVWASWCAPCRAETPGLERVYRKYETRGVAFLGINVRDSKAAASSFARDYQVTYPSLYDPDGYLVAHFRDLPPAAIPTTAVIDRTGRIAARFIAATTPVELTPVLDRLLGEKG
jgi:thiol-disulfide isomerase/thioredoxin